MSSGVDSALANATLDAWYPADGDTATVGTLTITGPVNVLLMTANGSDTAAGTELSASGGYSTGGSALTMAAASSESKASSAAVSWDSMPEADITGVETWDSSTSSQRIQWDGFASSISVASGDTLTIASGSLTAGLSG